MGQEELDRLNRKMAGLGLEARLDLILEQWGSSVGMTSAFGYSGMILMHQVRRLAPKMEIFFIDTGFHFPATLELVERVKKEWGLNIITVATSKTEDEIEKSIGKEAYAADPDACCQVRKVEPLLTILPRKKVWMHALRRDQASTREDLNYIELDLRDVLKVYPLVDWTREQCWDYIREHHLLYNPMHDEGYPSIGCIHCTHKVKPGEGERDGRWVSFPEKTECGLHAHGDSKGGKDP